MRGGRILLIIGIVLILAAVVVGLFLLRGRLGLSTSPPPGDEIMGDAPVPYVPPEGKDIIVAAQDIPRGTLITPDSGAVVTATWPQGSAADSQSGED